MLVSRVVCDRTWQSENATTLGTSESAPNFARLVVILEVAPVSIHSGHALVVEHHLIYCVLTHF
jgi:predicted secreted protein